MLTINDKTKELILEFEGKNQPGRWPGGNSGITIGVGYDLGHITADQFEADWGPHLSGDALNRLKTALGKCGEAAKECAPQFSDIQIGSEDAERVFENCTLPLYAQRAEKALPGVTDLPADVQGALLSLVYNRGTSMEGDRRTEMRAIRDAVQTRNLQEIANQLRSMKRLWAGQGMDGLIRRREAEAELVESAIG